MQHTVLTTGQIHSQRWEDALKANVHTLTESVKDYADQVLWIHTSRPAWLDEVSHFRDKVTAIVVLTNQPDIEEMSNALVAGAKGYLQALANDQALTGAAQAVANGALWIPGNLIGSIVGKLANSGFYERRKALFERLTTREQHVMRCVLDGMSNRVAAEELQITERTVKEHLSSVFRKLGVKDRMQLLIKAGDFSR